MSPYATVSPKPTKKVCILPFLRTLLDDDSKQDIICWTDKSRSEFRLLDQKKVAELWGHTKPGRRCRVMSYDNMARSLREFVKANLLEKMGGRTCGYRFVEPLAFGIDRILSDDFGRKVCSQRFTPSPATPALSSSNGTPSPVPTTSSGTFLMSQILTPAPTPSPAPVDASPDDVAPAPIGTVTTAQLLELIRAFTQHPVQKQ